MAENNWEMFEPMNEISNVGIVLRNEDCMVMKINGVDGEGIMTMYQVFDGIYLMYNDFHLKECRSDYTADNSVLCIDHCREGRIELSGENNTVYCVEKGDLRIDNLVHHSGVSRFPLSHYHGITIGFEKNVAEESLKREFPNFHFDLQALGRKFRCNDKPFVIHNEPSVEYIFHQLYQLTGKVRKDYFKVKVIELLVYLSGTELDTYKVEKPYFYGGQVEKIKAIQELITSDLTKTYTLDELSERFSISLTAMKNCFKATYGSPVYKYLKQYRVNHAASLLITRKDLKISEIAALVGYESPGKFTAVFREFMGITPLEYRNSH